MKNFVRLDFRFQAFLVFQIVLWPILLFTTGLALAFWTPLLLFPLGIIQVISACIGFFKEKRPIYGYYLCAVGVYVVVAVGIFPLFTYFYEMLGVALVMGLAYFAYTWSRLYE